MKTTFQNLKLRTPENIILMFVFLVGIILRVRQYLTGRSLWVDEAMLALNIVNRNFIGLFKPLDYDQGAPIGFLLVEKFFNTLLGRNELVLRLFPLLLGLLSLWIFYLLLKRFTRGASLLIGLTLFAINPRLIYYSSEVKQYIADVFVTILLLLLTVQFLEQSTRKRLIILAVAGFFATWFSLPSVFILAGIGITLFLFYLQKKDYQNLGWTTGMGILWLANIGFLYLLTLGDLTQNSYLHTYWQGAFAPLPPWSNWSWFLISFQKNMDTYFAITFAAWIVFFLFVAGWIFLFKSNRLFATVIAWILAFSLLASFLGLYPSLERMVLFLIPVWLLLISALLEFFNESFQTKKAFSVIGILLVSGYFLYGALPRAAEQFIFPKYFEHIRPSMEFLKGAWKEGDSLFLTNQAVPAFEYYAPIYGLENISFTASQRDDYENPEAILQRLDSLKGKSRVWVLMSHVYEQGTFNEKDYILNYLDSIGNRKREFRQPGTSVYLYLYDLNK